jgi:molecular chaperone DnaK
MSKIIGIDLGTTNTCAAFVSNRIPRVLPTEGGFNTMPSMVCMHPNGSVLVGEAAQEMLLPFPEHTLHGIKRLLGRQYNSRVVQELKRRVSYRVVAGKGGEAAVEVGGKSYAPVELQTRILQHIKSYAEINLGEALTEAVIAVPAYYSDHQRALVKEAGAKAGLAVRRIVNEPTAAALAYGFNRGYDQRILIYDLGGGTFDVSVLEITGNVFQVVATGGDTFLGGADFDNRILDWAVEAFRKQTKIDLHQEPAALERVRRAAERAKIELSLLVNTQLRVSSLLERRGKPLDLDVRLDRETLDGLTRDLVTRTLEVIDALLADRHLALADIDELIFVGGQSRMPLVVDTISKHFGKEPRKGVHPDECVALGASLLGDALAKIDAVTLLDALSVPIGIATPDRQLQVVIDKQTKLPHTASTEVPAGADGQRELCIDVYQGEAGPIDAAEYLGTVKMTDLPPAPAGELKVRVDLRLDTEGMLTIEAAHNQGGAPQKLRLVTVERPQAPITEAAPAEPAESSEGSGSGLRGLVRNLWGKQH